jgi:phosphoglycolate phosphatase-like HAD superfamily hydrolase
MQTLKLIDTNPEHALIIGDSAIDIIAGKAAKTATCLFTPQENAIFYNFSDSRLQLPDYEISNIGDLLSI